MPKFRIEWFRERIWINTRIRFIQRWAHRHGFCHVEKCTVGKGLNNA